MDDELRDDGVFSVKGDDTDTDEAVDVGDEDEETETI